MIRVISVIRVPLMRSLLRTPIAGPYMQLITDLSRRPMTWRFGGPRRRRSLDALAVHAEFAESPGQEAARGLSPSSRDALDDREPHCGNDPSELEARPRVELLELGFGSLATGQQGEHVQIHPLRGVGLV